jgi:hypothetical protein
MVTEEQPTESLAFANATWRTLRCSHRFRCGAFVAGKRRNSTGLGYDSDVMSETSWRELELVGRAPQARSLELIAGQPVHRAFGEHGLPS